MKRTSHQYAELAEERLNSTYIGTDEEKSRDLGRAAVYASLAHTAALQEIAAAQSKERGVDGSVDPKG